MLAYPSKAPWLFQRTAHRAIVHLARFPLLRRIVSLLETHSLRKLLEQTTTPGPTGGAVGYLFHNHDPELSASDIYRNVFSRNRFRQEYGSQMGQDMFLNRWFFHNRGPGFFVDVGAFDGISGSNTWYLEKHLRWQGVAFEPNPSVFGSLRANRSCLSIPGCAYDRDGEIPFLALSESERDPGAPSHPPLTLLQMLLDSTHGGAMLSGIPHHIDQHERVEWARKAMKLRQALTTVPCRRIDTVLDECDVRIVDYLSIDVEGAEPEVLRGIDFETVQVNVIGVEHSPRFPEVFELLTTAGFEYHGLLFFDEIFVHQRPRYSWDT